MSLSGYLILTIDHIGYVVYMIYVLTFLFRASFLSLNGISLICLITLFGLYPLCLSLCINLRVIELKLVSFELVLRYLFVSPLAIALMVAGG